MSGSKLKIDIRRSKILEQLQSDGSVSVSRLSETLGATTVTIRSDLSAMERDGLLVRIQGGAVPGGSAKEQYADLPVVSNAEEKKEMAAKVAQLVRDGDTLFINSGTTTEFVAEALCTRSNLNVVTNSLEVARRLGGYATMRVQLLGGEIDARYGFTCGSTAREQLSKYKADWAILSVDGVSTEGGLTTYHAEEAAIDRMMIAGAKRTLVVADHTKIGRVGFTRVSQGLEGILLVTDSGCDSILLKQLTAMGITVVQA